MICQSISNLCPLTMNEIGCLVVHVDFIYIAFRFVCFAKWKFLISVFKVSIFSFIIFGFCCCTVVKLCPILCDPKDCSMPGFPVHHQLPELAQTQAHRVVMPSNHLIFLRLLLLLRFIFPSIRVFSSESVLPIRWPKYRSFSFNISPSNEYSGLKC